MPSAGMPSARRSSSSRRAGLFSWVAGERRGPVAHLDGEQQLPAPGGVQHLDGGDRALVGDGEAAQLADLVAPELDAHRVLGRRREDVDDPAADGELAARGDHLDPRVGQLDEPDQQVVEVVRVADPQRHRVQPAQAGRDRLDEAACGGARPAAARWPGRRALRKIASRRPTVSGRGDSRSCGSVSQLGSTATASRPSRSAAAAPRSSASRSVAVTASTVRPPQEWRRGTAAAPQGPRRPAPGRRWRAASRDAAVRAPSSGSEVASRPESLATVPLAAGTQDRPLPRTGGASPQATRADSPASRHVRCRESGLLASQGPDEGADSD